MRKFPASISYFVKLPLSDCDLYLWSLSINQTFYFFDLTNSTIESILPISTILP